LEKSARAGGWLYTSHQSKIELAARLIKNDKAAGNFYEICEHYDMLDKVVSSANKVNKILYLNSDK
jgi:hypothetical protein